MRTDFQAWKALLNTAKKAAFDNKKATAKLSDMESMKKHQQATKSFGKAMFTCA